MVTPNPIRVGNKIIGEDQPCFIIAEVGLNHNGDPELARKLIKLAAEYGVDAIKFQKRSTRDILTKELYERPYDTFNSYGKTYGEHRERLELSDQTYFELADYCKSLGVIFMASPWDKVSADFLEKVNVPAYKIASADLTNLPLIEHIARLKKPIILSTGMSTLDEITEAVEIIRQYHNDLILLQCTSTYPTEAHETNLNAMRLLRETFNTHVGFSGHEKGVCITLAAQVLGAVVVERHFTLDRTLKGPDHAASLEPTGLMKLIRDIREVEVAMGKPEKIIFPSETPIRQKLAKSIVARVPIRRGTKITADMLTVKSPGTGLKPKYIQVLVGRTAEQDVQEDSLLPPEALQWIGHG